MKLFVIGSGKLASAILSSNLSFPSCEIMTWEAVHHNPEERAILVHAGSGRQLPECIAFCKRTASILIELSTGLEPETLQPDFTLIVCPNTSILLLKTMNVLRTLGHYFENDKISITESHQSTKQSAPGTAYEIARSLKFSPEKIFSVRDPKTQQNEIGIPEAFLDKHAYHKIVIEDGLDQVTIETKVLGHDSYARGVKRIIEAVLANSFERKRYSVLDLIKKNWL